MIFSVHSLYILVYDSYRKCLCGQSNAENCERSNGREFVAGLQECDDSGTEMDKESADEQTAVARIAPRESIQQGNSSDSAFYHEEAGLKFNTPVYIQRYGAVVDAICDSRWKGTVKKLVDMGCSEFGFFNHLKNISELTEVVAVDADLFMLESFCWKVEPLASDFLKRREEKLSVIVMKGSVSQFDDCLKDSDAIVCIELIEHLHPLELNELPLVIFGQVQPRIAVFTTPNSDFNVLFNNPSKRFRHPDHKFEWSRQQFQDWAKHIVHRFPHYQVEFIGVGKGPKGTEESHGCCSQMALFSRKAEQPESGHVPDEKESGYQLVKQVIYPIAEPADEEDLARKAKCKAEYHIHALGRDSSFDQPSGETLIPLQTILQFVNEYFSDEESLRKLLESYDWKVENNTSGQPCIKYLNPYSDNSECSDEVDVDGVHFESCHQTRPFSGMEMAEAAPRPWQSEPHLQAAFPFARHYEAPAAESLMFRSVNERQIFGYKSSMSDPIRVDDSGYPNSASVQDMDVTLGSSDDLSPSNEEEEELEEEEEDPVPRPLVPPPPFVPPAAIPANNHDAVNNNRDDEGNDLGLEVVQEIEPQPRLPEFPRWLQQVFPDEGDEGFADESSSSEDD